MLHLPFSDLPLKKQQKKAQKEVLDSWKPQGKAEVGLPGGLSILIRDILLLNIAKSTLW